MVRIERVSEFPAVNIEELPEIVSRLALQERERRDAELFAGVQEAALDEIITREGATDSSEWHEEVAAHGLRVSVAARKARMRADELRSLESRLSDTSLSFGLMKNYEGGIIEARVIDGDAIIRRNEKDFEGRYSFSGIRVAEARGRLAPKVGQIISGQPSWCLGLHQTYSRVIRRSYQFEVPLLRSDFTPAVELRLVDEDR